MGGAVVAAAAWARGERYLGWLASALAVVAGALALAFSTEPVAGALAFALCAGAGVAGFNRLGAGGRTWAALAAGVGATFIAVAVLERVATAEQLVGWPPVFVGAAAGAAFGIIAVAGRLPHHVAWRPDRVGTAFAGLGAVDDEIGDLARRARTMWDTVADSLPEGDANRDAFEDAVLRVLRVAAGWRKVEGGAAETSADELASRASALEDRLAGTEDAVAREQYRRALDAVGEQRRYLTDIGVKRERVVARLHNYLATLEQLRLAVAKLRSTEAAAAPDELSVVLAELEDMGRDMGIGAEPAPVE